MLSLDGTSSLQALPGSTLDIRVGTTGVFAEARKVSPGPSPRMLVAPGGVTDIGSRLQGALDAAGLTAGDAFEFRPQGVTPRVPGLRADGAAAPTLHVDISSPEPGFGQVILETCDGVHRWRFPAGPGEAAVDGREPRTRYAIPVAPPQGAGLVRGLLAGWAHKLYRVFVYPLVGDFIDAAGRWLVSKWEAWARSYRLRSFTERDYQSRDAVDESPWGALTGGRSLLFIHGTLSRADHAFGELPPAILRTLHERYDGRVVAFDHPSLSEDIKQNVEWFMNAAKARVRDLRDLNVDIVAHSRGGLVARALANALPLSAISRVVFVGTPNAGTVLAGRDRISDFIDAYTNFLEWLPLGAAGEILEAVLGAVKELASGAVRALPGVRAMDPQGTFLDQLNTGRKPSYTAYGLASNYEPPAGSAGMAAVDTAMDSLFDRVDNDLLVPTDGVLRGVGPGFPEIPAAQRLVRPGADSVAHTSFFGDTLSRQQLLQWLK